MNADTDIGMVLLQKSVRRAIDQILGIHRQGGFVTGESDAAVAAFKAQFVEQVQPLETFPALRGRAFFLVHPGFGISTPWSYQNLARFPVALNGRPGRAQRLVSLLQSGDLKTAAEEFYNSLEAPAFDKFPVLALYKEFLLANGALFSLMSGSGSTTFAIAENLSAAESLAEKFKSRFGPNGWTATVAI